MKKSGSAFCILSTILLVIGGLNWGLQGLGMLFGGNWNVVNLLLGNWPKLEAIIYIVVGLAALKVLIFSVMGMNKECCNEGESKGKME